MSTIILVAGSEKDQDYIDRACKTAEKYSLEYSVNIVSGHKETAKLLELISESENKDAVYLVIAGLSNALAGIIDANSLKPVITCPVLRTDNDWIDVFSGLRMPSDVCPAVILEPENAVLAAFKILALSSEKIRDNLKLIKKGNS